VRIESFDRATCRVVSEKIEGALQALAAELGVAIRAKGGSYAGGHYTLKIEVATKGDDGAINTREADDWKRYAPFYSFSADDLGRAFRVGSKEYVISGWRTKARAKPIIAKLNGKSFVFAVNDVLMFLGKNKKETA